MISREWYMFFLRLFNDAVTGGIVQDDLAKAPDANSALASYDAMLREVAQQAQTQPPNPAAEVVALLNDVRQELQTLPKPALGTMAALQQDNLPWVTFDTTPEAAPSLVTGTLFWDNEDRSKTLALVMEDTGEIIQDIGEETFYRVKASSAITKGQVVMFTGTVGASGGLLAAPATGLTAFQNEYIMGIATQNIALNAWGYVMWFGEVGQVNTTGGGEAWVDGQILYYNPAVAGGLTKTVPSAPNPKVIVASVVHAAANGIMFVRPTFGSALGATDSNVEITSLAGSDLLQYDSGQSRWENVTPASILAGATGAPVTKTANFTVAAGETWIINNKTGSTCTVTLPAASALPGRVITFQNYQDQTLVSASSNVVPRAGGAAGTGILDAVAGNWATLVSNGTNWVIMQAAPYNALLT
jgi:hypothetical protein